MLARDMGRLVAELEVDLGADEFTRWKALYAVEAKEREHAESKRRKGMR